MPQLGLFYRLRNPHKTVTHTVLTILAGNMMLYLLYYVMRKNFAESLW